MHNNASDVARAKGDPSKTLFISMLTRDISLADCIVDLLDNSADGVKELRNRQDLQAPHSGEYAGYWARINFDADHFSISDNCGGIPVDVAINYAFRFGKREEDDQELAESHTIGLYGIGMKRAMFKMGKQIRVASSDGNASFVMPLDVEAWRRQHEAEDATRDHWDFPLTEVVYRNTAVEVGTTIEITELYKN